MYDDVARRAQRGGGGALTALTPASCVRAGSSRRPAVLPLLTFGNPCLWGGGEVELHADYPSDCARDRRPGSMTSRRSEEKDLGLESDFQTTRALSL